MNTSKHIRFSFLTVFVLVLVVAIVSCSKKDVRSDEAGFQTDIEESEGAVYGEGSGVGTEAMAADAPTGLVTVYFDFDRYNIRGDARQGLRSNAAWLKNNPDASIQIEGHCDERGTNEYNLALGERRANSAKDYLMDLGIDGSRIDIISYGEERPANPSSSEGAWAENRRSEFVVLR